MSNDAENASDEIIERQQAEIVSLEKLLAQVLQKPTLRDQFAMASMAISFSTECISNDSYPEIAMNAYKLADAMLAEREKK